jgi:hypothetical protein
MLNRLLPKDRHLQRAVVGLLAFVILSLVAGGLAGWETFRQGELGREQEDLAQIVWQYGLGSPEAAAAVKQMGENPRPKELLALLDPATGKASAAWPAKYTGKAPEEMALDSGVKLPSLQMVQAYESFRLRRLPQGQAGLPADSVARIRELIDHREWVRVRLAHLYPWHKEGLRIRKSGSIAALPMNTTTPAAAGLSAEATAEHDDDWDEEFERHGRVVTSAPPIGYLLLVSAPHLVTPLRVAASSIGALAALGLLIYWLSVASRVFLDARGRQNNPFAWGMLALLTNLVGVAIYLIARRQWLQCPNCRGEVEKKFRNCPWCGHALVTVCAKCRQPLQRGWMHCAGCGTAAP